MARNSLFATAMATGRVSPYSRSLSLRHEGSCARGSWRHRRARRPAARWPWAGTMSPQPPPALEASSSTSWLLLTVRRRSEQAFGVAAEMAVDESNCTRRSAARARQPSCASIQGRQSCRASISLQLSTTTSIGTAVLASTVLAVCILRICKARTRSGDGAGLLPIRAHLDTVKARADRRRGLRALARHAAPWLFTVRVPWLLMAELRAGAAVTSVGTWGPMARDSHRGSCLGRACAWYRALGSYTPYCLCVNANLPHEGSRHSDKEI